MNNFIFGRTEQLELDLPLCTGALHSRHFGIDRLPALPIFDSGQYFFGPCDHPRRDAGKPRHLNPVAAVGPPFHELAQENDLIVPFLDGNIEIFNPFLYNLELF